MKKEKKLMVKKINEYHDSGKYKEREEKRRKEKVNTR